MFFIPLLFLFLSSTDRTNMSLSFGESAIGNLRDSQWTTSERKLISGKSSNFTVQRNLCARVVGSRTALARLSSSCSLWAPLGVERLTPSTVGGTVVITDKSSTAGEMLHRDLVTDTDGSVLHQETAVTFPRSNDDNVSSADMYRRNRSLKLCTNFPKDYYSGAVSSPATASSAPCISQWLQNCHTAFLSTGHLSPHPQGLCTESLLRQGW